MESEKKTVATTCLDELVVPVRAGLLIFRSHAQPALKDDALLGRGNPLPRLLTLCPFSDQFRPLGQLRKGPLDGIRLGMDVALRNRNGTVSSDAGQGEGITPGLG